MPLFSKDEKELIDRLKASGFNVARKQLDAPFRFMIRPFTTEGIPSLELASSFEGAVFEIVSRMTFESPTTGVVISPVIFNNNVAEPPEDSLTYKDKERSIFIGVNIDFRTWNSSTQEERLLLLAENIKHSVERIPEAYLLKSDSEKLLLATDEAYAHLARRLYSLRTTG